MFDLPYSDSTQKYHFQRPLSWRVQLSSLGRSISYVKKERYSSNRHRGKLTFKMTSLLRFNPLDPKNDRHLISLTVLLLNQENKENDVQLKELLVNKQILLVSTTGDARRTL